MTLEEIKQELVNTKFKDEEVYSFERSQLKPSLFIVTFKRGFQTNIKDIYHQGDIEELIPEGEL